MKLSTITLMLATAALMVASTVASAQTLKAEIPFAFQAEGVTLSPGTYTVTTPATDPWFKLTNEQTRKSLLLANRTPEDPQKAWLNGSGGVLQFACGEDGCTLARIWANNGQPAYRLHYQKTNADRPAHLAVIRMAVTRTK